MEKKVISPLLPKVALEYFVDGKSDNRLYLRATSIRNCLENIVETIFVHIVDDERKMDWKEHDLYEKINLLKDFFPKNIYKRLHNIRKIGNKGAHQSRHKELIERDIELTLSDLSQICEWTILAYFKKNGFVEHPWIPTVFSTLPPIYRIRILEELFSSQCFDQQELLEYQDEIQEYCYKVTTGQAPQLPPSEPSEKEKKLSGILLLIDKLAMAYLKNRERVKSIDFINDIHKKGDINDIFRKQMLDKLECLWGEIDNLPISENIEETKKKLDKILPAVKKDEESLFITLFTAITAQSD
jgi:hypothetical protein